jgi:hypothetical protein
MVNAIKILVENKDRGNRGTGQTIIQLSAKVKSRLGINMTNVINSRKQVREGLMHHGKCHQQLSAIETKDCSNHKKAITEAKTINKFYKRGFEIRIKICAFCYPFCSSGIYFRSF